MKAMNKAVSLDQIVLSKVSSAREENALESTMHSLALDHRSPIALKLAATSKGCRFLLRAGSAVAQRHLAQQIQARYPQVGIQAASTDPLALQENEECSAVELRPGAASYLPLRSWKPRDLLLEGVDPLLGILGACRHLPDDIRVVAHLALLPASPTWSAPHQRRAVEHPLAPEQERARFHQRSQVPSPAGILPLLLLVMLLLFLRTRPVERPGWLTQAGASVIHGQMPHLSLVHALAVVAGSVGILLLLLLLFVGVAFIQRMLGYGAIYDQRLVEEKTSRPAYRVLVRLVAITTLSQSAQAGPGKHGSNMLISARALLESFSASPQERQVKRAQRRQQRKVRREKRRQTRQRKAARKDVLRMLAAAYRQYHLASGGFFRLRWLSARRSRRYLRVISGHAFLWGLRWRLRLRVSNHLLSVADLAALWHLPQQQDLADLSYIEATQSRTLLVPAALTTGQGYQIGTSSHAGYTAPVFLPASCLHRNVLAVASTGKGKSNLFLLLAQAYLRAKAAGEQDAGGFVVVDPHGDVIDQLTGCVPPDLEDQVEVIDLSDRAFPVGINPLDLSGGQDRDKVVDNVVQIIAALWDLDEAPRTRNVLEYACKTLAEANLAVLDDSSVGPDQQYTLLDVVPLLRQKEFRHALMEQLAGDPLLREWWGQYYEQLDASLQADFSSSVVTRLSRFASTRISRRMLGQPRSTIDMAEVIRQEKILLIHEESLSPWRLAWRTLETNRPCHLQDLLVPSTRPLLPGLADTPQHEDPRSQRLPQRHRYDLARRAESIPPSSGDFLAAFHLTLLQWTTLLLLYAHPLVNKTEIATFSGCASTSLEKGLADLQRRGYVEARKILEVCAKGKASKRWVLTERGLSLLAASANWHVLRLVRRQAPYGPLQQRGLAGLLHQLPHTLGIYGFFTRLAALPGHLCW